MANTIDIETIKKWLNNMMKTENQIKAIENEIAYWKSKEHHIDVGDRVGALEDQMQIILQNKIRTARVIDHISDYMARTIFQRRFILGEKWDDVSNALGGMTLRNINYIYNNTLIEFGELWQKEFNITEEN